METSVASFFFFFQAEDGIRDYKVTGVQTCALPILSDVSMLPDTSAALAREWRSFDKNGSALGALINFGWVALAAGIALLAERSVARGLSRRVRRLMRGRPEALTLKRLLMLLLCDLIGVAVFAG